MYTRTLKLHADKSFLRHSSSTAPHYGDKFWLKQKHLKFEKWIKENLLQQLYIHSNSTENKSCDSVKTGLLIQKITRGFITRRKGEEFWAVKIQSCYRCYVARKRVARICQIRREEASKLIQNHTSYLGRKLIKGGGPHAKFGVERLQAAKSERMKGL